MSLLDPTAISDPDDYTPEDFRHKGLVVRRFKKDIRGQVTAEFQEREIYDFFGIVFDGHPDLRRITMPEDYVGWPQRRDFPIGGEPVIFTNTERERAGWYE
jgi:hypothetical protein